VQRFALGRLAIDLTQKAQPLDMAVALLALRDDFHSFHEYVVMGSFRTGKYLSWHVEKRLPMNNGQYWNPRFPQRDGDLIAGIGPDVHKGRAAPNEILWPRQ
jgi:hypothetical protein